jgi:MoaA/NifB/PqqE/SkfB family radical SAM enzyme
MPESAVITAIKADWGEVDEQGRLVLPPEVAARYGLRPGSRVRLEPDSNALRLHRPVTHLTKVYVEVTNQCNIACRTCLRNGWDEALGRMTDATFARVMEGLAEITPRPTVFFGGIGEPLFHKRVLDWAAQAKAAGSRVELITNGTLLTEARARALIDLGLDVLWVSLDGATPESYADIRLGAQLPRVLENLKRFSRLRRPAHRPSPEIGLAFVAMQRNLQDLPALLKLGQRLRAARFSVSNVLPCTPDLQAERLYAGTLKNLAYMNSPWQRQLSLPRLDLVDGTREAFFAALNAGYNVTFAGHSLAGATDVCAFIEAGTISVGWDGGVSPCLPLLHTHVSYLHGRPRLNRKHVLGNVAERGLLDVWHDPEYVSYRERVQGFAFAPCTFCGGCDLSQSNEEDCLGNGFPACGGCLWAQGLIQCP